MARPATRTARVAGSRVKTSRRCRPQAVPKPTAPTGSPTPSTAGSTGSTSPAYVPVKPPVAADHDRRDVRPGGIGDRLGRRGVDDRRVGGAQGEGVGEVAVVDGRAGHQPVDDVERHAVPGGGVGADGPERGRPFDGGDDLSRDGLPARGPGADRRPVVPGTSRRPGRPVPGGSWRVPAGVPIRQQRRRRPRAPPLPPRLPTTGRAAGDAGPIRRPGWLRGARPVGRSGGQPAWRRTASAAASAAAASPRNPWDTTPSSSSKT